MQTADGQIAAAGQTAAAAVALVGAQTADVASSVQLFLHQGQIFHNELVEVCCVDLQKHPFQQTGVIAYFPLKPCLRCYLLGQ